MLTELFSFGVDPIGLFLRGTIMYWFIFLVLRFVMRRNFGEVGPADILLLVLIADASSNAMTDEYKTISEGIVLVSTLFFWNWLLDTLALKFKFFQRLVEGPPILLIKNGKVNHRNLRKEKLSEDDLIVELRKNNLERPDQVKLAYFEGDGTVTVVPK